MPVHFFGHSRYQKGSPRTRMGTHDIATEAVAERKASGRSVPKQPSVGLENVGRGLITLVSSDSAVMSKVPLSELLQLQKSGCLVLGLQRTGCVLSKELLAGLKQDTPVTTSCLCLGLSGLTKSSHPGTLSSHQSCSGLQLTILQNNSDTNYA